jgi:DNA polymerase III subunit delta
MFSEWKILYIKNAILLERSWGRIKDPLQQYLESPAEQTIVIFDVDYWEGRSKLKTMLAKSSSVVEFQALSERELPSWVQSHLRALNFRIEPDALQALLERTGSNLQVIASSLEKLMLLRHQDRQIKASDVEDMVGHSPLATVWNWTEAILDQKTEMAIAALNDLLEKGEEPVYCIVLLAKQYEKMILTKEMVQQKVPHATISQKINKPVYYLQKYLQQLSRFSMPDLIKAVTILAYADRALKTGQAQEGMILQLVTLQLCDLKAASKPIFDVPLQ